MDKYKVKKVNLNNMNTENNIEKIKLTIKQKDTLQTLKDEKTIEVGSKKVNGRTMYSLYVRKLIKCPRYANGEFWEMTDAGYEALEHPCSYKNIHRSFTLAEVMGHTVKYKNGNILKVCGGNELGLIHQSEDSQTTFGFGRLENIVEILD